MENPYWSHRPDGCGRPAEADQGPCRLVGHSSRWALEHGQQHSYKARFLVGVPPAHLKIQRTAKQRKTKQKTAKQTTEAEVG